MPENFSTAQFNYAIQKEIFHNYFMEINLAQLFNGANWGLPQRRELLNMIRPYLGI